MLRAAEVSGVRTHLRTVPDETSLATFVWAPLKERYESSDKDEFEVELWETRDFHLREIAPRTYLLTYTLWGQGDRLTRRLTVWQGSVEDGWKVLYHQGTVAN